MPEVSSELVAAARKGKRDAIVELLAIHYPTVWRMAVGITGRADVGRGVVKYLMQRSLRAIPHWKDETAPTRWFQHHTMLTTRRTMKHPPDLTNDTLIGYNGSDPGYLAFVRAIRELPMQQREAFLLNYGEKLSARQAAVAMDCSTVAGATHLNAAVDMLRMLSPQQFDANTTKLARVYATLGPDEAMSVTDIQRDVRRFLLPWVIKRTIRTIAVLVLICVICWGVWWAWRITENSMK